MNVRLKTRGLACGYHGKALLPPVDLSIEAGDFWAIIGRNGAGKSTLMKTALGLLPPVAGRVERPDESRVAYVPQRVALDVIAPLAVEDVVAMGTERGRSFLGLPPKDARNRVTEALKAAGATELLGHPWRDLSEGQKQRVLLARALAGKPDVIFLDEPTAALDVVAEEHTLELLDEVRASQDVAIVIVAHYLPLVSRFARHVLFVDKDGHAAVTGSPAEVFGDAAFQARYGVVEVSP